MKALRFSVALMLLSLAGVSRADVDSGPMPGEAVPSLKVTAVTGDDAGNEADFAVARKDKPTVYVFVQAEKWDRPMARYLKALDAAVKQMGNEAAIVAVWLTADAEATKAYLPKAQNSISLQATTYALHPNAQNGPEGWGINSDAHVTTVVAGAKVSATFGHVSVNETVAPEIAAELRKVISPE